MGALLTRVRRSLLQGAIGTLSIRRRRILAWRSLSWSDVRSLTFERDGIVWSLGAPDNYVGFHLFVDGGFHQQEMRTLVEWLRRHGVFSTKRNVIADVGAHIGSTSIPLARETGCRLLAIEPVAENLRLLKMNVASNRLEDRILVVEKAVLRTPGRIKMCLTPENPGGNFVWRDGLGEMPPGEVSDFEDVEGDELTSIVGSVGLGLDEVALVWADVQGCEAEVIESGAGLWKLGVPLWAEVEPASLLRQGSLETFAALVAVHFDRFIESRELLRLGAQARPVSIAQFDPMLRAMISSRTTATDVLLLPPALLALNQAHHPTHSPVAIAGFCF
jgi:FkbM family methyltransferase